MAIWDFGPDASGYTEAVTTENVIDEPAIVIEGGEKDPDGMEGLGYTDFAGSWHEPGQGGAWNDVNVGVSNFDVAWILTINTTGWEDITIRWDYKSEDSPTFDLNYRLDGGGDWLNILDDELITVGWDNFDSVNYNVSLLIGGAVDNKPFVQFRFFGLDKYGDGKYVFDNLELTGVPEPCSVVFFSFGFLLLRKAVR
jgi:hypothetical protein